MFSRALLYRVYLSDRCDGFDGGDDTTPLNRGCQDSQSGCRNLAGHTCSTRGCSFCRLVSRHDSQGGSLGPVAWSDLEFNFIASSRRSRALLGPGLNSARSSCRPRAPTGLRLYSAWDLAWSGAFVNPELYLAPELTSTGSIYRPGALLGAGVALVRGSASTMLVLSHIKHLNHLSYLWQLRQNLILQ